MGPDVNEKEVFACNLEREQVLKKALHFPDGALKMRQMWLT